MTVMHWAGRHKIKYFLHIFFAIRYVGDVASSVYDSDEFEENRDKRYTQLYLEYEVDNEDPMAPFFPRLPPHELPNQTEKPLQVHSQSNSGSLAEKRLVFAVILFLMKSNSSLLRWHQSLKYHQNFHVNMSNFRSKL